MADPAKKSQVPDEENNQDKFDKLSFEEHLEKSLGNELIIGLCGPIGTDNQFVSNCLNEIMEDDYAYECQEIKISGLIKKHFNLTSSTLPEGYDYYKLLIDKGNKLRGDEGYNIFSKICIHQIATHRISKKKHPADSQRFCFIINSIKNVEEYELLKKVYSDQFFFVGSFSSLEVRKNNLVNIKKVDKEKVEGLIGIDSKQKEDYGQKVSETFVKADYFIRIEESNEQVVKRKLRRFLDLIFGTQIVTPNNHEMAMYQAYSAANNSSCLSRQVGASITDVKGDLLSVGWNDVPKFGGNLYPKYDEYNNIVEDQRCLNRNGGVCFNDLEKRFLAKEIANALIEENVIQPNHQNKAIETLIRDSRLKELIEFSRSVHAEMHAIINASQKSSNKMINGRLYCTTYPCHNCARHIIAAGITEVYYIEPYSKSMALKLHGDSITENESIMDKVKILIYDGVSPLRYNDLFQMINREERKKNGKLNKSKRKDATPKRRKSIDAIAYLEQKSTNELTKNKSLTNLLQQIS